MFGLRVIRLEDRIPPSVIDAAFAALIWLLARACPWAQLWRTDATVWLPWLAAACGLAGVVSALAGLQAFRRARTTVNPLTPARASTLVSSGIYRHTRNPMYLSMLLVLAGWGVWLGNALALADAAGVCPDAQPASDRARRAGVARAVW